MNFHLKKQMSDSTLNGSHQSNPQTKKLTYQLSPLQLLCRLSHSDSEKKEPTKIEAAAAEVRVLTVFFCLETSNLMKSTYDVAHKITS